MCCHLFCLCVGWKVFFLTAVFLYSSVDISFAVGMGLSRSIY